ncbi:MAG: hypothetical protein ABL977_04285 [Candidatus Eisenbacteria bacterium]
MNKTATRTHTTGGILFLLTGVAHTIGQFAPLPMDPGSIAVESAMKGFVIPGQGFTYWNVMQCWGALYGGMTFLFGALLLAVGHWTDHDPRGHRVTALTGGIAAVLQAAVALACHTPPPAFFMIPAAILFAISAAKGRA